MTLTSDNLTTAIVFTAISLTQAAISFISTSSTATSSAEISFTVTFSTMQLLSPRERETLHNLKSLIKSINTHARYQDYTVVIACTENSKKNVKRKAVLLCNRDGKSCDLVQTSCI